MILFLLQFLNLVLTEPPSNIIDTNLEAEIIHENDAINSSGKFTKAENNKNHKFKVHAETKDKIVFLKLESMEGKNKGLFLNANGFDKEGAKFLIYPNNSKVIMFNSVDKKCLQRKEEIFIFTECDPSKDKDVKDPSLNFSFVVKLSDEEMSRIKTALENNEEAEKVLQNSENQKEKIGKVQLPIPKNVESTDENDAHKQFNPSKNDQKTHGITKSKSQEQGTKEEKSTDDSPIIEQLKEVLKNVKDLSKNIHKDPKNSSLVENLFKPISDIKKSKLVPESGGEKELINKIQQNVGELIRNINKEPKEKNRPSDSYSTNKSQTEEPKKGKEILDLFKKEEKENEPPTESTTNPKNEPEEEPKAQPSKKKKNMIGSNINKLKSKKPSHKSDVQTNDEEEENEEQPPLKIKKDSSPERPEEKIPTHPQSAKDDPEESPEEKESKKPLSLNEREGIVEELLEDFIEDKIKNMEKKPDVKEPSPELEEEPEELETEEQGYEEEPAKMKKKEFTSKAFGTKTKKGFDQTANKIKELKEDLIEKVGSISKKAQEKTADKMKNVKQGLKNGLENLSEKVSESTNKSKDAAKGMYQKTKTFVGEQTKKVQNAMSNKIDALKNKLDKLESAVEKNPSGSKKKNPSRIRDDTSPILNSPHLVHN